MRRSADGRNALSQRVLTAKSAKDAKGGLGNPASPFGLRRGRRQTAQGQTTERTQRGDWGTGKGNAERGPSTMLPVESLSFDPEALDGWVERGPP